MKRALLFFLAPLFVFSTVAAQLPAAPSAILAVVPRMQPPEHKFFDRQNVALFAIGALTVAGDAITTQRFIQPGGCGQGWTDCREANPLVKGLVSKGWQGQLVASALGYSAAVGTSYLFHRTGHHRLERFSSWATIGIEATMTARNAAMNAR